MEENRIIQFPTFILRHQRLIRIPILLIHKRNRRSRVPRRSGRIIAQLRQFLRRVRIRRILSRTTPRNDEVGQGDVEDLIRICEGSVRGAGERIDAPDINESPDL